MIARDELVKSTFSIVVCVCSGKSQDEMKPTNSGSCLQLEEPSIHWMGQGPMHS